MAFQNKTIVNTKTGQDIRFIQTAKETGGKLLVIESTYNAHSKEPIPHYHPNQTEDFTVISGQLTVRVNGEVRVLEKGDTIHIPINEVHSMWNATNQKTVVDWQIRPALDTEHFLETAVGLANDGRTNEQGTPNILQVALMANRYSNVFRLSKPPFAVQKIVFTVLTPFAYLLGYRPTYKKYLD